MEEEKEEEKNSRKQIKKERGDENLPFFFLDTNFNGFSFKTRTPAGKVRVLGKILTAKLRFIFFMLLHLSYTLHTTAFTRDERVPLIAVKQTEREFSDRDVKQLIAALRCTVLHSFYSSSSESAFELRRVFLLLCLSLSTRVV